MSRTPKALRRLSVPILATMALLAAPAVIGTAPIASANPGSTLTITSSPNNGSNQDGYGSATPNTGSGDVSHEVKISGTAESTPQTIDISVTGSAQIVDPGSQPPNSTGNPNVLSIGSSKQTATCSTTSDTGATQGCDFLVADDVSEAVTVGATDVSDTANVSPTSVTDHFSALYFTNCPQNMQNNPSNCTTQQTPGTSKTLTVTYLQDGNPTGSKNVRFGILTNQGTFQQGPGTPGNNGNVTVVGPFAFTVCTTNSSGQCTVTVNSNLNASGNAGVGANTASLGGGIMTSNVAPYPDSQGSETLQFVTNATPAHLVLQSSHLVRPNGTISTPRPGEVYERTYLLLGGCTDDAGQNNCDNTTSTSDGGTRAVPLTDVNLNLKLSHGFFTDACDPGINPSVSYSDCTFTPAEAAGGTVGNVKNDGTTATVTTDPATGEFTIYEGIGRDSDFDAFGDLVGQLTATAGSVNLTEVNPGSESTSDTCTFGSPSDTDAGCPTDSYWSTDDTPLNGATTSIVWETSPKLGAGTNEIPDNSNSQNVFVIHLTDSYGNLTSGGDSRTDITADGAGELGECDTFTIINPCVDPSYADSGPNGAGNPPRAEIDHYFAGSFLENDTQRRFVIDSGSGSDYDPEKVSSATGAQLLTADWEVPMTNWDAPLDGDVTHTNGDALDHTTVNYYHQVPSHFTFNTIPGNTVKTGVVVTVQSNVKDQFSNPVPGQDVSFVRSGNSNCTDTREDTETDTFGSAGFTFTCQTASTQNVTVVVTDPSGVEEGRNIQVIHFTGTAVTKHSERPHLTSSSPKKGEVKLHLKSHPTVKHATVHFYRVTKAGGHSLIASGHTNSHGVAHATLKGLKHGKKFHFDAKVVGLSRARWVSHLSNTVKQKVKG